MNSDWPPEGAGQPIRLWTLRKGDDVATGDVVSDRDGRALVVHVNGAQAFRVPLRPGAAEEYRDSFIGWQIVPDDTDGRVV